MRLSRFVPVLTSILFLFTVAAHADDVVRTLVLNGTYVWNSQDYTATGTITFDADTGEVFNVDLDYGGAVGNPASFTSGVFIYGGDPFDIEEAWNLGPDQGGAPVLDILIPVATLAGYEGGNICSLANPCGDEDSTFSALHGGADFIDGTLSPAPEPSSLTLLATGALAMLGLAYGRRLACFR